MAIIATGSRHDMSYVAESTYGTTPATPTLTPIRHTGTTLALTKDSVESEELRQDRQVVEFRHGNHQIGGDINCELSYGTFDDFLQAALGGTWQTDVPSAGKDTLVVGTTRRSFTIERYFEDITQYLRYTGVEFNGLNLSISPNAMVTCNFSVLGQGQDSVAQTAISGSSYAAATTTKPFDSFTGSITENGSPIAIVTSIEISLENGLETAFVVGSKETNQPTIGKSRVTGTLTAYFVDETLINKFINETESSIELVLTDLAGNAYTITLPRVKYNSASPDTNADGAITVPLEFVALYDSVTGTNFKIVRDPV